MTRLDKFLLMLLAGLGWAGVFALLAMGMLKGVPGSTEFALVFAGFGFVAGAVLVPLRLALQARTPEASAATVIKQVPSGDAVREPRLAATAGLRASA